MNAIELFRSGTPQPLLYNADTTGKGLTPNELFASAGQVARGLLDLGVERGDTVLVMCSARIEAVESVAAALFLGAAAVPLSPHIGLSFLRQIVTEVAPACCILDTTPNEGIVSLLIENQCAMVLVSEGARLSQTPGVPYSSLKGGSAVEPQECDDSNLALVTYTSGSNGRPKAISMDHQAFRKFFVCHNKLHSQYSEATLGGRFSPLISPLPAYHLAGLAMPFQGLLMKRPTYLMPQFSPKRFLQLVADLRCTLIRLVPSMYEHILSEQSVLQRSDFSSLRICVTLGEPCPPLLAKRIEATFHAKVVSSYGLTECLAGIGHSRRHLFGGAIPQGSCGKLLFGTAILIDEVGRPADHFGELWIRNETVHQCYQDATLNQERIENGFFKTRDLFAKDAEGNFYFRGRLDDMVVRHGKNLYPAEVEAILATHPLVDRVCVIFIRGSAGTPVIVTAVVKRRGDVSKVDLVRFFQRNGPSYALPQRIVFVEQMPLTATGKLDRQLCAHLASQEGHPDGSVPPTPPSLSSV
jgi:acyl-CoA synthetase (AMP-forming)/AMP-acid ligase II